jgi:acetylornithine deacetylase
VTVDLLRELAAIPSVSGNEGRIADRIVEICASRGAAAERRGRNVLAVRGAGRPALLLASHTDTVPPVDGWSADPFTPRLVEGRLVGLGVNDAKASVAAMLEAFLTAELPEHGSLLLAATCDEETGGEGLEALAPGLIFDAAIIGEPNGFAVAAAQKGLVKLRLISHGRAGHASRPQLAENAIVLAARDVLAIEALRIEAEDPYLGRPTATVTMAQGGVRSNIVPDRCELIVDARTTLAFDNERMIAAVRRAVGSEVEILSDRFTPVGGAADTAVAKAALEANPGASVTGFAGVSDLLHVAHVPSIVFGPGTPGASHRADESIALEEVERAPGVYRRAVAAYFRIAAQETS